MQVPQPAVYMTVVIKLSKVAEPCAEPREWRWLIHSPTSPLDITFTLSTQSRPRFLKVLPQMMSLHPHSPHPLAHHHTAIRPSLTHQHTMEQMLPKVTNDFLVIKSKGHCRLHLLSWNTVSHAFHNSRASFFLLSSYSLEIWYHFFLFFHPLNVCFLHYSITGPSSCLHLALQL